MKFSVDNLLDIALIFEQANGNNLGDNDALLVKNSGLDHCQPEELEKLIISTIVDADPEYRSKAYWVLGKRFNKNLVHSFNEWLEVELNKKNPDLVYQILIALDNQGLSVFGTDRDGSYSSQEADLNMRDARLYLDNHA